MASQDMAEVVPLFGDRKSSKAAPQVDVAFTGRQMSDARWNRLCMLLFQEPQVSHDEQRDAA